MNQSDYSYFDFQFCRPRNIRKRSSDEMLTQPIRVRPRLSDNSLKNELDSSLKCLKNKKCQNDSPILQIGQYKFMLPSKEMSQDQSREVSIRIGELKTYVNSSEDNEDLKEVILWDIMKIHQKIQLLDLTYMRLFQSGLGNVQLNIANRLTNLRKLNVSCNSYVNDEFLYILPTYCEQITYINIDDCTNVSSLGVAAIRGFPKFKHLYLNYLTKPRIYDVKRLCKYSPISILNEDCMTQVFLQLPLSARLNTSQVCQYWNGVIGQLWLTLKNLDLTIARERIDYKTLLLIMRKAQGAIRHIDFAVLKPSKDDRCILKLFQYIGKHILKNLLTLNLSSIQITCRLLRALDNKKPIPKLKKLIIGSEGAQTRDALLAFLGRMKNLLYLEIKDNQTITGAFLKARFDFLETLKIHNSSQVILRNFDKVIESFPQLKNLSISGCRNYGEPQITIISKTLKYLHLSDNKPLIRLGKMPALEVLDISHNVSIKDSFLIAVKKQCQNLLRVNISYCPNITDDGLKEITSLPMIEHLSMNSVKVSDRYLNMYNLKTLECRNCTNFYNAGVIQLLSIAPMLELLDLSNCQYITQHLVDYAIKETKKRKNDVTLKMYVGGTNVQTNEIMDESPFLQLFNLPDPLYKHEESDHYYYSSIDQFDED